MIPGRVNRLDVVLWSACLLLSGLLPGIVGCRSTKIPERPDRGIERPAAAARAAFAAGYPDRAAALYEESLERARQLDRADEIATAAYNLAVCLAAMGRYEAALIHLEEAQNDGLGKGGSAPEIALLKARLLAALDRLPEAMELARAERQHWPAAGLLIRLQWHVLLADWLCASGRLDEARLEIDRLDDKALKRAPPELRAEAWNARARIAMEAGTALPAAHAWDEAARNWQAAGRAAELAGSLEQAAAAWAAAGRRSVAAERAYRAARSLAAAGCPQRALTILEKARPWADEGQSVLMEQLAQRCRATTPPVTEGTAAGQE